MKSTLRNTLVAGVMLASALSLLSSCNETAAVAQAAMGVLRRLCKYNFHAVQQVN